ncbi:hypothetical protein H5410_000728 [Solanum commersonii]|uniref:DUF4283 domain-containing protein n=1 Tax=Solanum commersonii TaxID=4109 RepID=A0A9J6AXR6_SOLCO|nr:hypothetical protein H5410_000728 [Solanum commersonii]
MARITASGVNNIYYNAGFKSYEITRCKGGTDSWYEWTESSRKLVRRVKISIKVLRWLVSIFIEASKNVRFVSFIDIQGQNKSIIITPEFIHGGMEEAVQSSRWMSDSMKRAKLHVKEAHIEVTSGAPLAETDLLNRCIVGRFQDILQETPALNDVRRWVCNTWKSAIGVNVFAMNDGQFLFELPSRVAAEHVMSGVWAWKKMNLSLYWWKPTTGCWPDEVKRDWVWIRVMGLPLSLWSSTRIKVKGDGEKVPREVKISSDGYAYKVPIWCKEPVTVRKVETRRENEDREPLGKEVSRPSTMENPTVYKPQHVGTSTTGELLNWESRDQARDRSWKGKGQAK